MHDILSENLSMNQRGILITIILNNDYSPKITLAKCKASFNFSKNKEDLIHLHDKGFINWSGVEKARKSLIVKEMEPEVLEILNFMNELYSRSFKPESGNTRVNIMNRLKNNSIDDLKKVISNRYAVWKDDPKMSKHLNPTTIFRASKFDKYLEEVNHTREGESFVNASNLKLEDGTEITTSIARKLIDTDNYNLKLYSTDGSGIKRGVAKKITRSGNAIKKLIHVQNVQENYNGVREYRYYYNKNI